MCALSLGCFTILSQIGGLISQVNLYFVCHYKVQMHILLEQRKFMHSYDIFLCVYLSKMSFQAGFPLAIFTTLIVTLDQFVGLI